MLTYYIDIHQIEDLCRKIYVCVQIEFAFFSNNENPRERENTVYRPCCIIGTGDGEEGEAAMAARLSDLNCDSTREKKSMASLKGLLISSSYLVSISQYASMNWSKAGSSPRLVPPPPPLLPPILHACSSFATTSGGAPICKLRRRKIVDRCIHIYPWINWLMN